MTLRVLRRAGRHALLDQRRIPDGNVWGQPNSLQIPSQVSRFGEQAAGLKFSVLPDAHAEFPRGPADRPTLPLPILLEHRRGMTTGRSLRKPAARKKTLCVFLEEVSHTQCSGPRPTGPVVGLLSQRADLLARLSALSPVALYIICGTGLPADEGAGCPSEGPPASRRRVGPWRSR
jgi:hypothetical protein